MMDIIYHYVGMLVFWIIGPSALIALIVLLPLSFVTWAYRNGKLSKQLIISMAKNGEFSWLRKDNQDTKKGQK